LRFENPGEIPPQATVMVYHRSHDSLQLH
jgi:hypothetical protein